MTSWQKAQQKGSSTSWSRWTAGALHMAWPIILNSDHATYGPVPNAPQAFAGSLGQPDRLSLSSEIWGGSQACGPGPTHQHSHWPNGWGSKEARIQGISFKATSDCTPGQHPSWGCLCPGVAVPRGPNASSPGAVGFPPCHPWPDLGCSVPGGMALSWLLGPPSLPPGRFLFCLNQRFSVACS